MGANVETRRRTRRGGYGARARGWSGEGGQLAGLPEADEVFEAVEQAGEGGEDEGVQRRDDAGFGIVAIDLRTDASGEAGDVVGQGRVFVF